MHKHTHVLPPHPSFYAPGRAPAGTQTSSPPRAVVEEVARRLAKPSTPRRTVAQHSDLCAALAADPWDLDRRILVALNDAQSVTPAIAPASVIAASGGGLSGGGRRLAASALATIFVAPSRG